LRALAADPCDIRIQKTHTQAKQMSWQRRWLCWKITILLRVISLGFGNRYLKKKKFVCVSLLSGHPAWFIFCEYCP
jgi:hypothetical protein